MKICGYSFFYGGGGHYGTGLFFFFFFWGGGGVWGVISIHFRAVKIQNGNIIWAAKFQIFFGIPDIPDFFFFFFSVGGGGGGLGVNSRCWVQAYV